MDRNKVSQTRKIVHILSYDKFTSGYVNFMKEIMDEWQHFFIMSPKYVEDEFVNCDNIYSFNSFYPILLSPELRRLVRNADKIIVSGVFESHVAVSFFSKKIIRKTFLHFWGGDFYNLRKPPRSIRSAVKNALKINCSRKCAGLIFLIDGEYEKFFEITNVKNKNYIAPMPSNPFRIIKHSNYRISKKNMAENKINVIKILVGNSATDTNHHVDVFKMLEKYPAKNMEVYVPLSYGNSSYRDFVLMEGTRILGESFYPMLDFMKREDYISFLSGIDIGIFNNDRQQGMGNINTMLGLGKKVFVREDTSMWKKYINEGWNIYSVSSIANMDYKQFTFFDETARKQNERLDDTRDFGKTAKEKWNQILDLNNNL